MDRRAFVGTMTGAAAMARGAGFNLDQQGSVPERMTIAAVGDCIPGRRLSGRTDEPFRAVVELLRRADCTWANCEAVLAKMEDGYPAPKETDPNCLSGPWGADELAWMGIDFVGTANNHILDWGYGGLFATLSNLERAGIAHAGSGKDLAEASGPAYFDSPAGRVAQVNCASTFPSYFAAGAANASVQGRPGLNPLRLDKMLQLDRKLFDQMAALMPKYIEISGLAGFPELVDLFMAGMPEDTAVFGEDLLLKPGDEFDLLTEAKEEDLTRICHAITIARNNARVVLATLHAHEARFGLEQNDHFNERFAHKAIDAGADMVFSAGPHVLRGLEIYQGKPVFYSLSNFVFHYESQPAYPAGNWEALGLPPDSRDPSLFAAKIPYPNQERFWETIVPVVTIEGGVEEGKGADVVAVELHPVTLGFGEPIWRRGTPELARGEKGRAILETMVRLSEPYGTSILIRDGVGHVVLG